MITEQRKEIIAYLSGPRAYKQGVALYKRYGDNLRLKREFTAEENFINRELLVEELRKLAGLSAADLLGLPRLAVSTKPSSEPSVAKEVKPTHTPISATMSKMIRFREKYTFLNSPECPDVLKVLVADMFTAYGKYKEAHARLQEIGDKDAASAVADCETLVEEYLNNREIWDELEYYRAHGEILGKAAKFREMKNAAKNDVTQLSDIELMGKLKSAQANESKHRKALAKAKAAGEDCEKSQTALANWSERKRLLQKECDRRKKKQGKH